MQIRIRAVHCTVLCEKKVLVWNFDFEKIQLYLLNNERAFALRNRNDSEVCLAVDGATIRFLSRNWITGQLSIVIQSDEVAQQQSRDLWVQRLEQIECDLTRSDEWKVAWFLLLKYWSMKIINKYEIESGLVLYFYTKLSCAEVWEGGNEELFQYTHTVRVGDEELKVEYCRSNLSVSRSSFKNLFSSRPSRVYRSFGFRFEK